MLKLQRAASGKRLLQLASRCGIAIVTRPQLLGAVPQVLLLNSTSSLRNSSFSSSIVLQTHALRRLFSICTVQKQNENNDGEAVTLVHRQQSPAKLRPSGNETNRSQRPLKDSIYASEGSHKGTQTTQQETTDATGSVQQQKAQTMPDQSDRNESKDPLKDEKNETSKTKETAHIVKPEEHAIGNPVNQLTTTKPTKKLSWKQKIVAEAKHYWQGTKLFCLEVKISTRLMARLIQGYELTRRENRQLRRTLMDLARMIPFSVFVLVPFMELLLPFALKFYPGMLPSTYEGAKEKEAKKRRQQKTRQEVSTVISSMIKKSGLPISMAARESEEFKTFFKKVRADGEKPSYEDTISVCRIFRDEITLDNLSRSQLVAMCKYLNLNAFGSDAILRFQIRNRMKKIKRDDRYIDYEGIDELTVPELVHACAARGIRTMDVSVNRLKNELSQWLEFRLRQGVPSTLLVLANIFSFGANREFESPYESLVYTLSSLPDTLYHEAELDVSSESGDTEISNAQRLQVLHEQEQLIEHEGRDESELDDSEDMPRSQTAQSNDESDKKDH